MEFRPQRSFLASSGLSQGQDSEDAHVQWTIESKYHAMSMALSDPCGITRMADGKYLEVNPAFCRLFGASRDEIIGKTSFELNIWAADQRDRLMEALARDGRAHQLSLVVQACGREVRGQLSASTMDIEGQECMVFVFHDMTREQAMYDRMSAAHALLAQAGKMARLGAWETDARGVLIQWSDSCCELHGLPPGTPPPHHYIDAFIAPAHLDHMRQHVRACLRDGTAWMLDLEIVRADTQSTCWVRSHGEAVREGGRTLAIRGVIQDIDNAYRSQQALKRSQKRFQLIFNLLPYPMGIVRCDTSGYVDVNPAWCAITGISREHAMGKTVVALGIYTPEERQRIIQHAEAHNDFTPIEATLRQHDGQPRTVLQVMRRMWVGEHECWLFALNDITERKRAEEAVREREALLSLTLKAASLGLWDCNLITGMVSGDAGWQAFWREGHAPALATPWEECTAPVDRAAVSAEMQRHAKHPERLFDIVTTVTGSLQGKRWVRNLGKIVAWDARSRPTRMLGVTIDVTNQRQHEIALQRLAHYDALTHLPNRVLMAERLAEAMARSRQNGLLLGVAYIDLDGFKPINDRFGHDGGDRLLRDTAKRLSGALRPQDCVARLGGDEFVILLPDLASPEDAKRALDRVMRGIAAEHVIDGSVVSVTASIGYTLFPRDDSDADTLLRHADQAMYLAKQAGRNRYKEFDALQDREARHERAQLVQLREALNAGHFELYLQPKVDMRLGTVVGAEALARWNHPERGVLSPAEFQPLLNAAESETGFGAWVVQAGLRLVEQLQSCGRALPVSLNIAAPHFQELGFAKWMHEQLSGRSGPSAISPELIDLEITETAALYHLDSVAQSVRELRALGLSISLDDFGTGYSSLTYLRRLPINNLKIDQSFVRGMLDEPGDLAIVQGVIGLARSFGYKVVAEGVETEDEGHMLLQMGCTLAQGYFIARPMPIAAFLEWMQCWEAPAAWRA